MMELSDSTWLFLALIPIALMGLARLSALLNSNIAFLFLFSSVAFMTATMIFFPFLAYFPRSSIALFAINWALWALVLFALSVVWVVTILSFKNR